MTIKNEVPLVFAPAPFVPIYSLAFGDAGDAASTVSVECPLPVSLNRGTSKIEPMTGVVDASALVGPFSPELGRPIWVTLSGEWAGIVRILRSVDNGETQFPLTAGGAPWAEFVGNVNEPIGEESEGTATYYIDAQLTSGFLCYRVAQ